MHRVLGFNNTTTTVTSGSTSTRGADFTPLDTIYLELQDKKMFQGSYSRNDVLTKSMVIPWVSRDQNKVYHRGGNGIKLEIRDQSEFSFKFTDEKNNVLGFLGGWSLTLLREN